MLIPTMEIAIGFKVLFSVFWFPTFREREKLEVHRHTDDASATKDKRLALIDAIDFLALNLI